MLVGFCGETEDDHQRTLELMDEVRFDTAFMFAYSDRGITAAARKLTDDVPHEVKQRRLREVIDLQETHTRASYERFVGQAVEVLISGPARRGDRMVGRTPHFHSVLLPRTDETSTPGRLVNVRIVSTTGHSLLAAGA